MFCVHPHTLILKVIPWGWLGLACETIITRALQSPSTFVLITSHVRNFAFAFTIDHVQCITYLIMKQTINRVSLVPRPHPLMRRNGLVNQVEFLGLAGA